MNPRILGPQLGPVMSKKQRGKEQHGKMSERTAKDQKS